MDNSFFTYLEQLELMAFFSGYPLLYAVIIAIGKNKQEKRSFKNRLVSLLPLSYAMVGTLFLGLQLKKLYPDYTIENINHSMQQPWLITWGLLSLLFWIPALGKKPVLSLIHSLVFFFFLLRDLFLQSFQSSHDKNVVRNDMKIYSDSLLLNGGVFILIVLFSYLFSRQKNR